VSVLEELGWWVYCLKGFDKLHEKLPGYPGRRIALLPLRGLVASTVAFLGLILLDILPRIFSSVELLVLAEPFIPLLGSLLVAAVGLWLIGSLWNKRDVMKAKYGSLAYQKMISRGVVGVFLIPSLVFHAFTSIRSLPPSPPVNELTTQWSQSLLFAFGITGDADLLLRIGVAAFLFALGALTVRSALTTFGIDYMTVVYLYFPDESEVQQHEIYSVVRHPAYLGAVLMGAAAFVFRCSVYSALIFIIVYGVFRIQIAREERELVERFGNSYKDYMKKVPALHVRLHSIRAFARFLTYRPSR